jgi:flagellar biogenesis protein FliO
VADAVELVEEDEQEEAVEETNYALRLTQALEAISAAQVAEPVEATYSPVPTPHAARPTPKPARRAKPAAAPAPVSAAVAMPARARVRPETVEEPVALAPTPARGLTAFLAALDKLPPIRLPIGPPIPWRLGLPLLAVAVVATFLMARPTSAPEPIGTRLPAQEKYAVQQDAPLFATAQPEAAVATPSAPIGVAEPAGMNVDLVDVGIKFLAVLALAYGSLVLLKRVGVGGAAARGGQSMAGVRVVSSMTLAPNRTVHVIRTPGGKSLLVGATPAQVNLIADLGELDEDALAAESGSFFDVLSAKLPR